MANVTSILRNTARKQIFKYNNPDICPTLAGKKFNKYVFKYLKKRTFFWLVATKARRFFSRDSLLRGMAGQGGVWREFLGSENQIFPRQPFPGEENFDFFLANPSPARKI